MEDGCFGNASRCCGHITHILLKFATSKTGRNVIGGILLFIVTVLALLATLMACMASFVVAQFSDQFHPPMPHNTVISSSFTIGRKNPVTGEVEKSLWHGFPRAGGNGDCGIIGGYSTKQME